MKQLVQSLKDGKVDLFESPTPLLKDGHILISTSCSAISSGTEKMLLDFGRSNLIGKALSQPDKFSEALKKLILKEFFLQLLLLKVNFLVLLH